MQFHDLYDIQGVRGGLAAAGTPVNYAMDYKSKQWRKIPVPLTPTNARTYIGPFKIYLPPGITNFADSKIGKILGTLGNIYSAADGTAYAAATGNGSTAGSAAAVYSNFATTGGETTFFLDAATFTANTSATSKPSRSLCGIDHVCDGFGDRR